MQYAEAATFVLGFVANESQGTGFGDFLNKLGFGDTTGPALDQIQTTLTQINAKLDQVQASLKDLSSQIAQSECTSTQNSLGSQRAKIETLFGKLRATVSDARSADAAKQKSLASSFTADLTRDDPASIARNIHNTLASPGFGANSMITSCGMAFQDKFFHGDWISSKLNQNVTAMVSFWQTLEAEATVLAVEQMNAANNRTGAASTVAQTQSWLQQESALIKPSIGDNTVLDTRTGLMWQSALTPGVTYDDVAKSTPAGFRLATTAELQGIMQGCCNTSNSIDWLTSKTPISVPSVKNINGQVISVTPPTVVRLGGRVWTLRLYGGGPLYDYVGPKAICYAAFVMKVDTNTYRYS